MRVDPPWPESVDWEPCVPPFTANQYAWQERTEPLDLATLTAGREAGQSIVMMRFSLAEARDRPLPADLLRCSVLTSPPPARPE
jgi:hypothetical protein